MAGTDVTGRLARYMAEARERELAPEVAAAAKHRILDTLAAMVSGSHLKPGEMAIRYARSQGGVAEASVLTTDIRTSAVNAALANAMFGHADETDDFHPTPKAHPGCAVVPAALAMGEREGSSGTALMKAVALGYDLACRFLLALGADHVRATHRSAEGTSSTMGAVGAAASLACVDEERMRYALSYQRRPYRQPLHASCTGHAGESARHRKRQRQGAAPDRARTGRVENRRAHPPDECDRIRCGRARTATVPDVGQSTVKQWFPPRRRQSRSVAPPGAAKRVRRARNPVRGGQSTHDRPHTNRALDGLRHKSVRRLGSAAALSS
ncbi:MAG TPA: MmgE/PrpD family protein [Burkholderiales bacterium]|nr:MmgE/PrpD family protein [Burkholderiales bacterium]